MSQDNLKTGRLEGKVAVITGSDSGMGQAMAVEFAREGADVAVTYLHDQQGADKTRQEVEAQGRRAIVVQIDQRDEQQVAQLFQRTRQELGTPFILVNDAGVDSTGKQVAEMPPKTGKMSCYSPPNALTLQRTSSTTFEGRRIFPWLKPDVTHESWFTSHPVIVDSDNHFAGLLRAGSRNLIRAQRPTQGDIDALPCQS
ncbi:SDR family NAD(P)-dependent oxidoreductase [Deinococcus peraridilitoris]|uniref:Short-chain alcohol dehydrogenase n=1 Tax=Deinococcus peraridilitoris (strain DSM 19664 / LMG 22246 / CIP 109416 / KR-200) TaxID=937777 RepID=L0A995_DEIPD|nr:SDR family NAD(P)-dependent oxidoreductase [Deinococcus peraridilitoris]AFZ69702.1 dehydrogenase of unknown specificity, short-chain alcohol dehydrogenase like protein [Deinococcus peraridilitoris DSM 19664]